MNSFADIRNSLPFNGAQHRENLQLDHSQVCKSIRLFTVGMQAKKMTAFAGRP